MQLKKTYREPHFFGLVFIASLIFAAGLIALWLALNLLTVVLLVADLALLMSLGLYYLLPHPRRHFESRLNRMVKKDGWQRARANDVFTLEADHLLPDSARAKKNPHTLRVLFRPHNGDSLFLVYREVKNSNVGWPMILVKPVVYIETQLSSPVNGWLRLWPRGNVFFSADKKMPSEANEKRRGVLIQAGPNSPGKKFFSSDFLAWYEKLPLKPGIHLEGSKCTVVFEGQPTPEQIEELMAVLDKAVALASATARPARDKRTAPAADMPAVDQRQGKKTLAVATEEVVA